MTGPTEAMMHLFPPSRLIHALSRLSLMIILLACQTWNGLLPEASATTIIKTKLADGSIRSQLPGGSTVTKKPDGTLITRLPEGVTYTVYPDGTTHTQLPRGGTITTNPDGGATNRLPDGTKITIGLEVNLRISLPTTGRVTERPNGMGQSVTQPDGTNTLISPSGDTVTTLPDGTVIYTNGVGAIGHSTTIFPSGASLSTLLPNQGHPDSGSKAAEVQLPDKTRIRIYPDGTITIIFPDDRQEVYPPTESVPSGTPPSLKVPPLQQTPRTSGSVVSGTPIPQTKPAMPQVQPLNTGSTRTQNAISTSPLVVKTPPPSSPVPIPYPNSNFQIQLGGLPQKTVVKIDVPSTTKKTATQPAPTPSPQRAFGVVPRGVEGEAEPAVPPTLILDSQARFVATKTSTVTVPAGEYAVVDEHDQLRLIQPDGGPPSFTVASSPAVYEGSITGTALLWLPSESQNGQLLLLLEPDGRARYTTAHTSDVRPRGTSPVLAPRRFLLPSGEFLRLEPSPARPGGAKQPGQSTQPLRIQTCGTEVSETTTTPAQTGPPPKDEECRDMNPGALHVVVTNFLGR